MIKNLTRKTVLSKRKKYLKTDAHKFMGLMFSKKKDDFGLVFFFKKPMIMSLHMYFVFYPIDLVFLDEKSTVIELKENFKPFTVFFSKKKAKYFLEVPNGTIKKTKTKVGDKISF